MKKITLFLLIAVMAVAMVIPASAATVTEYRYYCGRIKCDLFVKQFMDYFDIPESQYKDPSFVYSVDLYYSDDTDLVFISQVSGCLRDCLRNYEDYLSLLPPVPGWTIFTSSGEIPLYNVSFLTDYTPGSETRMLRFTEPEFVDIVSDSLDGSVFDEIISLLPVILVCVVSFIGIRKGIDFLMGFLRKV